MAPTGASTGVSTTQVNAMLSFGLSTRLPKPTLMAPTDARSPG